MNLGDNYICDAINDGFPLCCVVSTDNFLRHGQELYRKSILVSPVPENSEVLEKLLALAGDGIGVMVYGTQKRLARVPDVNNLVKLDVERGAHLLREAMADFGYSITYDKKEQGTKPPTMAMARHDNGLFFSVYNANTTTDTRLRFPLGAPILCGGETQMIDGASSYRFARGEHRECRVYAEQADGVISCREAPP